MSDFTFDALRRFPDVEAVNLAAVDATDRLILDEAVVGQTLNSAGDVVVIGDNYGALTLGAASIMGLFPSVSDPANRGTADATDTTAVHSSVIRVHQDLYTGTLALRNNSAQLGSSPVFTSLPLGRELVAGAKTVLWQLPRGLDEIDEIAQLIAAHADPDVVVFAGGRIKHLSLSMNEVLSRHFGSVKATLARQKSRVLVAVQPQSAAPGTGDRYPVRQQHDDLGFSVFAHGGVFAGAKLDIGTRFLLTQLDSMLPTAATAIDLGCGSGILATALALSRPELAVIATDRSRAATSSARATVAAAGVDGRVTIVLDNGLDSQPDASADLIVCNPPFHSGAAVHAEVAHSMFRDAARVLRPGGELWTVYNSHLGHAAMLRRLVGKTTVAATNSKFTVAVSVRS
jgi:16S rRNA (guanine1207-N2)-methyltransferase